jgi:hypothetical protein
MMAKRAKTKTLKPGEQDLLDKHQAVIDADDAAGGSSAAETPAAAAEAPEKPAPEGGVGVPPGAKNMGLFGKAEAPVAGEKKGGGGFTPVNSGDPDVKGKVPPGASAPPGMVKLRTTPYGTYVGKSQAKGGHGRQHHLTNSLDLLRTRRFRMINEFRTLSV